MRQDHTGLRDSFCCTSDADRRLSQSIPDIRSVRPRELKRHPVEDPKGIRQILFACASFSAAAIAPLSWGLLS